MEIIVAALGATQHHEDQPVRLGLMLSGSTLKLTVKRYVIKFCAGFEPLSPQPTSIKPTSMGDRAGEDGSERTTVSSDGHWYTGVNIPTANLLVRWW
jgi:hypothetical protein